MRIDSPLPTRRELSKDFRKKNLAGESAETTGQGIDPLVSPSGISFPSGLNLSWVSPVIRFDGTRAVLKLAMPHMEGKNEIQGLRYWSRTSMIKLLDADDDSGAMLLERCLQQ